MKDVLAAVARSLLKTTILSAVLAGVAYIGGYPPLTWFATTFVAQFILFYFYNMFLEYKATRDSKIFLLKEAEIVARNTLTIQCANCKKENEVIVFLNIDNRFICGHCNTKNGVYISAEAAVVTEPKYETEPLPNTNSTNGL